ncbi:MAG: ABC transporter permease [Holdemanella sp.]|nr:ABC transporter permease [Holdemanella sp.]
MNLFKNLYAYRELLKTNIKKDIRGKYKGSFLGILWSFLTPLLQVVVYWLVFPYIMGRAGNVDNYLCYLVCGIIPWTFFTSVVTLGTSVINNNKDLIKKVYFPREILPISQAISGLINFFISCSIIVIFCIGTGAGISFHIVLLPVIAIIQFMLNLGIVFILSALNVYIRDIEFAIQFIINLGFYASPIIYPATLLPKGNILTFLITINPITILVNSYRDIFLNHRWPDFTSLGCVCLFSLGVLIIGYFIFKKLEKGFAEQF